MDVKEAPSIPVTIFIAGDYDRARQIVREFCMNVGACATVTPTTYIYTGGEEAGVIVGFINYPRFPAELHDINYKAELLAEELMRGLCQHSYTIQLPATTRWFSRRPA